MKKIVLMLFVVGVSFLFADANQETLNQLGKSGGLVGGTTGIAIVHGVFWIPMMVFFIVSGLIIGVYYKMFKQKDDGAFKTVGAFALGIVLGILMYVGCLKLVDTMFDAEGCGGDIVTAYMKDSVKKGLNPSEEFGGTIKGLACIQ